MNAKSKLCLLATSMVLLVLAGIATASVSAQDDAGMVALGKAIFFDANLSANGTQSCATCHAPEVGFTGPDAAIKAGGAVYQGALPNRYGNRKPPASAYAGDSPVLHQDDKSIPRVLSTWKSAKK